MSTETSVPEAAVLDLRHYVCEVSSVDYASLDNFQGTFAATNIKRQSHSWSKEPCMLILKGKLNELKRKSDWCQDKETIVADTMKRSKLANHLKTEKDGAFPAEEIPGPSRNVDFSDLQQEEARSSFLSPARTLPGPELKKTLHVETPPYSSLSLPPPIMKKRVPNSEYTAVFYAHTGSVTLVKSRSTTQEPKQTNEHEHTTQPPCTSYAPAFQEMEQELINSFAKVRIE